MMLRRVSPLVLALWWLPVSAVPRPPIQVPASLRAAADSVLAINQGDGDDDSWPDLSDRARLRSDRRFDRVAAMLRAIPSADLAAPEALLLADNLREAVNASIASRVCRYHLWAGTSPFSGWHVLASNASRVAPVGTAAARERALARFRDLPARMKTEEGLLRRGLDSGFTASGDVIRAVVRQLDDLMPDDPARSPLYSPAVRDSSAAFRSAWTALLTGVIYPAGKAYRDFLEKEYLPRARTEGSMARQRDGVACYAASLRSQTSVQSNLDSLMRAARRDYDRVAAELAPLVRQLTGTESLGDGVRQLRTDPRFTFPSRDSILPAYRAMTVKAAGLFGRVVAGFRAESVTVAPYPEFQEKAGLPPMYLRASEDGARPAQFLVNLSRTERMSVADAVAHEGYPGHHLQRIAETRAEVVHPVMRTLFVGGFIEGWGIYSERLAEEMGLYETPLDRAGYLVHLLDVMVAAYLDVGYHTRGWSRKDLADTMMVLGGRTRQSAEAYADRHAATPGQLATYYVGYQAISAYREGAARTLGAAFQAAEFHREVLRDGTITLASLGAKIDRWVKAQSAGPSPVYSGPGFARTELAPGVFAFVFDNPLGDGAGVDGTAVVIINDADVVVIDTQWSPATARRVLAEIRKLTPNPVRYVVNTHWHGDHWFGNQVYRDAFPGVEFIAHRNTLNDLEPEITDLEPTWKTSLPQSITDLEGRYAKGIRRDGQPYTAADSAAVRKAISAAKWAIPMVKEIRPVTPTLIITDSLVLRRGDRTIEIRYLGRGNTRGDLTVWLPRERVLATGDLLVNPAPYSFGSYLGEWARTLGELRKLPAVAIVPGHGAVQRDWAYVDLFVELLGSTLAQAKAAVAKGMDLEATRKAVDLSAFRERFTRGDAAIGRAFDAFYVAPAVERAWLEARGELDKAPPHAAATDSSQSLEQRLQHRLDSLHQAGRFIGATAAVLLPDGRLISLAAGLSDSAGRVPMRTDLRMLAGSTGKTFFAALAWQLAFEGRLPLDAPISRWLGQEAWFDSLPNARQITVRQVMSHSSGLVRYELNPRFLADLIAQPDRAYPPVEELRYLFGSTAAFAAGQGWDYSDTNYIVLAMILERITGTRAYDEIRRRFLEPLHLDGTIPSDRQVLPGLAQGYAGADNPFGPFDAVVGAGDRFALNPQFEWAGGGFASTSADLARWARALYTGTVVDTAFLRRDVLNGVAAPMLGPGARYGLGVIIRDTPLGRAWGHSGFFPGYLTEMRWYPDRRVAIAVMVNQNRPGRGPAGLIADLAALTMGEM